MHRRQLLLATAESEPLSHQRLADAFCVRHNQLGGHPNGIPTLLGGLAMRDAGHRQAMDELSVAVNVGHRQVIGVDVHAHGAEMEIGLCARIKVGGITSEPVRGA